MQPILELYERHAAQVLGYLYTLCRDEALAQELTQETFTRAMTAVLTFRGTSSPSTWLCSIARHCYLDEVRRHRRVPTLDNEILLTAAAQDDPAEQAQNNVLVQEALESLEERTRRVVVMRSQGYAFSEISARLELNESSARVLYHRALKTMREHCEGKGPKRP